MKMSKKIIFVIAVFATIIITSYLLMIRGSSAAIQVSMQNNSYAPLLLTIKQDETVLFINNASVNRWPASNIHPTHGIYPEFDPQKPISPGESWSFTFNKKGVWRFHDHLAPEVHGAITVK